MSTLSEDAVLLTKKWLREVVIGLNFCPFAAKPFRDEIIRYNVVTSGGLQIALETLIKECMMLESNEGIETTLIIFPHQFGDFKSYLQLVDYAEQLLQKEDYEGVFQVASFHPQYLFAGSREDDAANYTNRSPYPMLHILRESSLDEAISKHKNINAIPDNNIIQARTLGVEYFKKILYD